MAKMRGSAFWTFFCLAAILLGIFYAPVLFFDRDFFTSDHSFYFEPFAKIIAWGYSQGHLPLWNPYCYCGMPQIANPSPGIFYFPNFLFVGLPYSKALGYIMMFHQLVAFTGAFLLIESLGWGVVAAAFCGIVMTFNGYMMSLASNYTLPGTAAWGVLAIYALVNIARPDFARPAHKIGFVVLTALSVHWMIMCGRPEVFVPMMALLGATAVFINVGWISPFVVDSSLPASGAKVPVDWRSRGSTLGWQLSAMVLGILLSAPSLVPVYEWSKLSPRSTGLSMDNVFKWSSNWYDFLCMLCSQPLGDLQQPTAKYMHAVSTHKAHYPFLPSPLIGPIAITLMFVALFDRTYKVRWQMLAGLTVAVLLAMGRYGPLSAPVLKAVPFLLVLRYPCKLLIIVILFAAVLGGRGLYVVAGDRVKSWQKKFFLGLWLTLLAVSGVLQCFGQFCGDHLGKYPGPMMQMIGFGLMVSSFIGLFVAALIAFAPRLKLSAPNLALVLVLLTGASIFAPAMKNAPKTTAPGFFERPQYVAEMVKEHDKEKDSAQGGRVAVVYFDPLKIADGYEPRQPTQIGETYMQYDRELLIPNTFIDSRLRETFGYEASENKDFRAAYIKCLQCSSSDKKGASDVELARFCLITGTKFLASQIENHKGPVNVFNKAYFKLVDEDDEMNVRLYEALSSRPRAYFAGAYRTIKYQDDAIDEIFAPVKKGIGGTACDYEQNALIELDQKTDVTTDPLNFSDREKSRASAVLSGVEPPKPVFSKTVVTSYDPASASAPKVSFLRDEPEHISISVNAPANGFLILNDRYYPGWHAVVDTQPAPMYRGNAFVRAVYLGKGSHLVEFNYEPESLRNGLYLAAIALLILVMLSAVFLREPAANWINFLSTGKSTKISDPLEKGPAKVQEQSSVLD